MGGVVVLKGIVVRVKRSSKTGAETEATATVAATISGHEENSGGDRQPHSIVLFGGRAERAGSRATKRR